MEENKLIILLYKIPPIKFLCNKYSWMKQFISFGIVGVSNTLISYLTYVLLVSFNVHPQIANIFGFILSVANAYLLNRYWVFKETAKKSKMQTVKFFAVYVMTFFMGVFFLFLYIDVLNLNKYIAPILSLIVTTPTNFLLNKLWVFKEK